MVKPKEKFIFTIQLLILMAYNEDTIKNNIEDDQTQNLVLMIY